MPSRNVVLIGFSGAGKTTVAPLLAARLGMDVYDTDAMVEAAAGAAIARIFAAKGERGFREMEAAAVAEAAAGDGRVIVCGGGAILSLANFSALRDSGTIVYLRAAADTLVARLASVTDRPLLGGDHASTVPALLNERAPAYRAAADLVIDTDGRTPEEVADEIVRGLKESE